MLVHNCDNIVKSDFRYSKHALERMTENNFTESMVKKAIEKGVKYYNPKNGTYNYILKNGFASGKNFVVGQNTIDGTITMVGRYRNIPAGLIKVK